MADRRPVRRRQRRSPRLRDYDYRQPGLYFVTVVTKNRQLIFGDVVDGKMRPSDAGTMAEMCWQEIPSHHFGAEINAFVVMPNHVHGLIALTGRQLEGTSGPIGHPGRDRIYPVPTPSSDLAPGVSLSTVVGTYKAAVTRAVNRQLGTPGASLWQRSFHDRIVRLRAPGERMRIRRYIDENPARWTQDRERPTAGA